MCFIIMKISNTNLPPNFDISRLTEYLMYDFNVQGVDKSA